MDKLSISERTLAKYRDEGIIPYHQVRGSIRYMESEIEEMMEKFKVPAKRSTGD
ncbi:MAG: helix-turn-helix domain-containing protein [Bacteroidetes bacterium]|nr:helix-turn-helix domain-containing protein [Bacteroidota bacterium]